MSSFEYKIIEHLLDLPSPNTDWVKEVNLISWNGREPVYDIRTWSHGHTVMGKGISLNKREWDYLVKRLGGLSNNEPITDRSK